MTPGTDGILPINKFVNFVDRQLYEMKKALAQPKLASEPFPLFWPIESNLTSSSPSKVKEDEFLPHSLGYEGGQPSASAAAIVERLAPSFSI